MAILHTREQGLRVHGLANLGGLVAIAGLEEVEPPLLLGLLLELADHMPAIHPERRAVLAEQGRRRLDERNAEKRAWKAFQKARDLHRVDLTSDGSPALDGLPALRALLGWESGQFRLRLVEVDDPPAIAHPTATLLNELMAAASSAR